jgi:hypothetical protein
MMTQVINCEKLPNFVVPVQQHIKYVLISDFVSYTGKKKGVRAGAE